MFSVTEAGEPECQDSHPIVPHVHHSSLWPVAQLLLGVWPVMGSLYFVFQIQGPGIGVLSVSKGAEIGLAMACFLKQVAAIICINGPNAAFDFPIRYRDLVISPVESFLERMQIHVSGALCLFHCKGNPRDKRNQQSVFPIEKAQGQILFIIGEGDQVLNSMAFAKQALEQLKSHRKSNGRMLVYPGAGHLLEPPYAPHCYASRGQSTSPDSSCSSHVAHLLSRPLLWGGDPAAHAAAQEHAWGEIQKFFRQHLPQTRSQL